MLGGCVPNSPSGVLFGGPIFVLSSGVKNGYVLKCGRVLVLSPLSNGLFRSSDPELFPLHRFSSFRGLLRVFETLGGSVRPFFPTSADLQVARHSASRDAFGLVGACSESHQPRELALALSLHKSIQTRPDVVNTSLQVNIEIPLIPADLRRAPRGELARCRTQKPPFWGQLLARLRTCKKALKDCTAIALWRISPLPNLGTISDEPPSGGGPARKGPNQVE